MLWTEANRSLLGLVLLSVHSASVALTDATFVVVISVPGAASEPRSLTAVA